MHTDPGWSSAFGRMISRKNQPSADTAIVQMRTVFVGIVTMMLILVVVNVVLATDPDRTVSDAPMESSMAYLIVGGLGAVALAAVYVVGQRPWPNADAASMVNRFRTEMFIRLAMSEAPLFVGMALVFIGAPVAVFLMAAGVTLVSMAMIAPTLQAVTRRQEQLMTQGGAADVRTALYSP